jgi:hypothetical protein
VHSRTASAGSWKTPCTCTLPPHEVETPPEVQCSPLFLVSSWAYRSVVLVCQIVVCTPFLPKSPLPAHNCTINHHHTPFVMFQSRNTFLGPHWFNSRPKRCVFGKAKSPAVTCFVWRLSATSPCTLAEHSRHPTRPPTSKQTTLCLLYRYT